MGNLTHTVSGDIASFRSAARVPIESLKCHFLPKQDLHGYDRPWPGGGGKNLLPTTAVTTITDYGITFTVNSNGSIHVKGTATLSVTLTIATITLPAGTYYVSGGLTGSSYINIPGIVNSYGASASFTLTEQTTISPRLYITTGETVDDTCYPMIRLSSISDATWEPYENICPIEGWTDLKIRISESKNLFSQDTLLKASGWIKCPDAMPFLNGVPVYSGTIANLAGTGKPFHSELPVDFNFKPNTRYRISWWWRRHTPSTANGLKAVFVYTDETTSAMSVNSNNTESFIRVAHVSTANKTVKKIYLTYNSSSNIYIAGFAIEEYDVNAPTNKVLPSAIIYSITFPALGKNKIDKSLLESGTFNMGGDVTNNKRVRTSWISVIPGQTYTMSIESNKQVYAYQVKDINNNFIYHKDNADGQLSTTYTIPDNGVIMRIVYAWLDAQASTPMNISDVTSPQLELGNTATEYEPYNPNNTVYGGYVDIAKGEVVAEWLYFKDQLVNARKTIYDTRNGYVFANLPIPIIRNNKQQSNLAHYQWEMPSAGIIGHFFAGGQSCYIALPLNTDETQYFELVAELQTPIHYPLSKTELKTFLDQNNIWSNTNDITEVSYQIHDSNMIRSTKKQIIGNEPHIETSSGTIATCNTDIAAPLKECKIYFNPIQEGSEDPSPENVREISGWMGLSINHTGKNLLNPVIAFTTQGGADPTQHVNSNGSITVTDRDGTSWTARGYLDLPPGTYYFYSEFGSGYNSRYIINDVVSEVNFSGKKTVTITEPTRFRFKAAMGTEYPVTGWLQVFNADDTYGEFPYINNIQNITWNSSGTIYGGYVDLINGKLYSTYRKLNLSNITWYNFSGHTIHFASILERPANGLIFSNMLTPKINTIAPGQTGIGYYNDRDNERKRIYVQKNEAVTNDTEFRTWFAETYPDAYIVYELETPIEYTLTPQQIKTIKGINNIWSNTNGNIEIKYWTH